MTAATHAGSSHVNIAADRVAKTYAQAILDAAEAAGCRDDVLAELGLLARDVLPKVPGAAAVFASPKVAPEEKSRIVGRLTQGRMTPTTTNTLHVLARHGRLDLLGSIVDAAERLAQERDGKRHAVFTTATPLAAAEQQRIVGETEKALATRLVPSFVVDPDVIGGLIVRIGDTIYDQSVATGLARIGDRLHTRNIHAIQNGEYSWRS